MNVLFVEDVLSDAELITLEIERGGQTVSGKITETKEEFIEALKSFDPDIIICDYSLPQFDGMKALELRNELSPNTPFILVTGSINEEVAVECMKAGADDYILKNNLSRLSQALNSVIAGKKTLLEKERAENLLKEKDYLYDTFMNTNKDIMFVKDEKFRYIIINKPTSEYFNKPVDQIIGKTDFDLVGRAVAETCLESDQKTLLENAVLVHQEVINERVYETTKFPLKLMDNKTGIGAIIRDITERYNSEEALRQKILELEKFNDLTVDRELKMIELKREVNDLLKAMGKREKYNLVE